MALVVSNVLGGKKPKPAKTGAEAAMQFAGVFGEGAIRKGPVKRGR